MTINRAVLRISSRAAFSSSSAIVLFLLLN
nr:MAG TPA: hypothetical protein [Caudoviricetes sp.]